MEEIWLHLVFGAVATLPIIYIAYYYLIMFVEEYKVVYNRICIYPMRRKPMLYTVPFLLNLNLVEFECFSIFDFSGRNGGFTCRDASRSTSHVQLSNLTMSTIFCPVRIRLYLPCKHSISCVNWLDRFVCLAIEILQ